jgi:hypothetical protein
VGGLMGESKGGGKSVFKGFLMEQGVILKSFYTFRLIYKLGASRLVETSFKDCCKQDCNFDRLKTILNFLKKFKSYKNYEGVK